MYSKLIMTEALRTDSKHKFDAKSYDVRLAVL